MTMEKGKGWVRFSVGRTSVQLNFIRPDWAKKAGPLCLPRIDIRKNVPTADWMKENDL